MATLYCDRCGFKLEVTQRIHSKHTGLSFCADIGECKRRADGDLTYEEISQLAEKTRKGVRA